MSKYLIFPCLLSDEEFITIKHQRDLVSKCVIEHLQVGMKQKENINYHLARVIIDIEEVVSNRNLHGYRYNSYLLNMIELKLIYIYELMRKLDHDVLMKEITIIAESCFIFASLIDSSYDSYEKGLS